MRVAILHDYLNQFGGAERVLQALLEIFPQADLYTLLYDEQKTFGFFRDNIRKTSFLDIPYVRAHHRRFIPLMPLAAGLLRSREHYDLLVSSTAGYGKGINVQGGYHISYCHSPLRYAWEIDYLKNLPFSPWPLKEILIRPIAKWLQNWDKRSAQKVNLFIANSAFIAQKIRNYYGRDAAVVYPPVETQVFYPEPSMAKEDYFLMVGRLLYYKGFDLGIKAFNALKLPLKIIGQGPEITKLQKIADPHYVQFIPFAPDEELRFLYSNAKALIFPQIEDFGLVAAEAQMCGLPILAFDRGGAREIVENGKTGFFFHEQTAEAIAAAVRLFNGTELNRSYITKRALMFSKKEFKDRIHEIIRQSGFKI
ncbi:MAG: Glycosyl transferase group 1 [Candidatus Jorgensenbacteria bacterium GW2011_GWA1_48_11]|uniref:Glycosyl transferase group 1 n=1 Tax=Candidatus Jorgensenbacteria bacterium GW2011_GWA1_48_11 TaxID=1618660 RepID=A0A0G1UAG9_9BACT|nr:MAG: Glycosyl transferase group 1 [Candidatus Jorgensenbacteria bacterium GW2011_GWA1_48_11]KKW11772.1 MAG: Glycosyl transferase group 1 [Candidatus Jorgensenbacteria bacterium GW2011_GWB1_49_9]